MVFNFLNFTSHSAPETPGEKPPRFTEADFLPYACHHDPHTILTKNGELLQIVRIAMDSKGHAYESSAKGMLLRDAVRTAIRTQAASPAFAFWFHTLRRRQPIAHQPHFAESSAASVYEDWQKAHHWAYSFRNEVYISILRRGQTAELLDFKELNHGMLSSRHRRYRETYLQEAQTQLNRTVKDICKLLSPHFQAECLGFVERDGVIYSEPMEFLHTLLNVSSASIPVANMDASRQLSTHELTFGYDTLEARTEDGKRRFAALLSVKGCPELPTHALDRCLQLPEECIITQSISFLPPASAAEKRNAIRDMLETSPDEIILQASGLSEIMRHTDEGPADFASQHTSILMIRDHYRGLDEAVARMQQAFGQLGLITVREDIMLEENFWAQLPGNFEFIRRTSTIPSGRMAGLVRLNHFPCGDERSVWGSAVAIVPTTLETPYAFHFHVGTNGHTALLDFNSFTDGRGAVLTNFLLSQTRQYGGRMIVLDRNYSARPLIQGLRGTYVQPVSSRRDAPKNLSLNPLQLPDTPRNRAFLSAWLHHFLVDPLPLSSDDFRHALETAIEHAYTLAPDQRSARKTLEHLAHIHPELVSHIRWPDPTLFDNGADTLDASADVLGIELGEAVTIPGMGLPIFSYLLHRLISTLDGRPTIIVVHEAWDMLDNEFFAARIASLLEMLTQHNAMLLLTTRQLTEHADSYFTQQLLPLLATTLFVPDDIPSHYYGELTGITPEQESVLTSLERQKGEFLIRHGTDVLACSLPLTGMDEHLPLLVGDTTGLRLAQIRPRGEFA